MIFTWVLFVLFCAWLCVYLVGVSRREKASVRAERHEMTRYADVFALAPTKQDHFEGVDIERRLTVWRNTPADVWRLGLAVDVPKVWGVGPRRRVPVPASPETGDDDFDDAFHVRDGAAEQQRPYLNRAVRRGLLDAKAELSDGWLVLRLGRPLPPLELALGRVEAARELADVLERTPAATTALVAIVEDHAEPADVRLAALRSVVQRGAVHLVDLDRVLQNASVPGLVAVVLLTVNSGDTLRRVGHDASLDPVLRCASLGRLSALELADARDVDVAKELAGPVAAKLMRVASDARADLPPPEAIEALGAMPSSEIQQALELLSLSMVVDAEHRQAARRALAREKWG